MLNCGISRSSVDTFAKIVEGQIDKQIERHTDRYTDRYTDTYRVDPATKN